MDTLRSALARLKAVTLEHVASRPITTGLRAPAVSLTFDDVPQSAVRNGVPILLDHHADATFYVASGLGSDDGGLAAFDLETLNRHGFDIACHTYSHYSLDQGTTEGLALDAERNRVAFEERGLRPARDFSYPFGEVTASAKRVIGRSYATARSVYPGVNGQGSDLLLLRANTLFSSTVNWEAVRRLLGEAAERTGWVIFYTHGVDDNADVRGCTPDDLDRFLIECERAGLGPRSVRSVGEELLPHWP